MFKFCRHQKQSNILFNSNRDLSEHLSPQIGGNKRKRGEKSEASKGGAYCLQMDSVCVGCDDGFLKQIIVKRS